MSTTLTMHENIRSHIDLISENQEVTQEALGDVVKKAKSWWAGRAQRSGNKELDYFTDQHAKWLGVLMGRQGVDYPELNFNHLRNYLAKNNINLEPTEIDSILQKVRQQYNLSSTTDQDPLSTTTAQSQQIARSIIRQGIMKASSKLGLGQSAQQKSSAAQVRSAQTAATPATTAVTATKPTASATTAVTPPVPKSKTQDYPNWIEGGRIQGNPALQVDMQGKTVRVYKVAPQPNAPSGWIFFQPDVGWVKPKKGSPQAEYFDDYWAAKTSVKEASTEEIQKPNDDLLAAQQAEQQGDKARQYEKLADYHEKFSKVKNLKPADRIHHTTHAGIYRNAAHAVKSAQETLAKSST